MPTYEALGDFLRDWRSLTAAQQTLFLSTVPQFVAGLKPCSPGQELQARQAREGPGVWVTDWGDDGWATFHYGAPVRGREPHVVWRRIAAISAISDDRTRNGNAVLLPESSWQETTHLLRSPANARRLAESIAEVEGGRVIPHEAIKVDDSK